ncbi:MAG TPA: ABC transporter permease [Usitatibacter sp.]|nr:ABC transporter permease [Usitatibacter sp.]
MAERREERFAGESRWTRWLVAGPPAAFLLLFFAVPALIVVLASFREPGEFGGLEPWLEAGHLRLTLDAYRFLASDWIYAEIFARSLLVAGLCTMLCVVLAYPLAWVIARSPRRRRDLMILLVVLPFASNLLVRVYAWIILLGPAGLLYTPFAVVAGLVYVHLPFMVLPLYANLEMHDPALLEAARNLGAGPWTRFRRVTFPLSLPGIYAGSALVFIPILGMFAIPELLGGTGDILVGNLIKEAFLDNRDWPLGAALSIGLTVAVLALAALAARGARRRAPATGALP